MVSRLTYTFVVSAGRVLVEEVAPASHSPEPIWLAGRLHVRLASGIVVAAATSAVDASRLARRLQVARRDVRGFVPRWHGVLTAYLPKTVADFDALVGAPSGNYDDIAAVTTTLDGSHDPRAPLAVVLNPRLWPLLRPRGAHVVVTHEAVHAATGSVTARAPDWLTEGFADYVAVRSAGVPLAVAGAEALRAVRAQGPPIRLPTNRDFASTGADLERAYELSRLAMLAIARHYGQRRLVAFYGAVVGHPSALERALRDELGTTRPAVTRLWRRLLVRLAGAR